jgi:predicted dehydrogenase
MDTLRIGVIGVGGRGVLSHNAHQPERGVRLVAGADVRPEYFPEFRRIAGEDVFLTDDYRRVLDRKDVDAVFITTPDFLHEEHTVAALEAGKAVYLEKPMAITIAGCDRILRTAMRTRSKLYLGHNMRHYPAVLKMKELIDAGTIGHVQAVWCRHFIDYGGEAYYKDWHAERQFSTGLLLQKAAHDIDVIHWLVGSYADSVVGMGRLSVYDKCQRRDKDTPYSPSMREGNPDIWPPATHAHMNPVIDVEDHSMILMQLANGIQCSYNQCHFTPDGWRNYTFIGDRGRIENIGDSGDCEIRVWTERRANLWRPDLLFHLKARDGSHGGADPRIINEFIDFIRDGKATNTSPVAARNAIAVGCMATESLRTDNAIRHVPMLDPLLAAYFDEGQGNDLALEDNVEILLANL